MWRNRIQTGLMLAFFLIPLWSHLAWRSGKEGYVTAGALPDWLEWNLTAHGLIPQNGPDARMSTDVRHPAQKYLLTYERLLMGDTLAGLRPTGWMAEALPRTVLSEGDSLAPWLVRLHREVYGETPSFPDGAIYLTNRRDSLVVLLPETDLTDPLPRIATPLHGQREFGVPDFIRLPGKWALTTCAQPQWVVSYVELPLTEAGKAKLQHAGLPSTWPILVVNPARNRMVVALDARGWSPSPVWAKFAGMEWMKKLFYINKNPRDVHKVYWEYLDAFLPTWAENP